MPHFSPKMTVFQSHIKAEEAPMVNEVAGQLQQYKDNLSSSLQAGVNTTTNNDNSNDNTEYAKLTIYKYTKQTIYDTLFLTTQHRICSQSPSSYHGTWKSQNSPKKVQTPRREDSNSQKRADSCPRPSPFMK